MDNANLEPLGVKGQGPQNEKNAEWERKQRLREYRVAARREKRTRKADEKKQRKLNATILRRMTKNPEKYNKNAERNRRRDIETERRRIWGEAVKQAQRLAAVHDPSGAMFNIGPVTTLEDGAVVSLESLERAKERAAAREAAKLAGHSGPNGTPGSEKSQALSTVRAIAPSQNGVNPDRLALMDLGNRNSVGAPSGAGMMDMVPGRSKTQQRKLEAMLPRPPPPKPVVPKSLSLPEGEEDWLALWDLSDDQLERRVVREKKRKAAERKALRERQQAGKQERRAARDEKRRVYRDIKQEWKAIKAREKEYKRKIQRVEQEAAKTVMVEINRTERRLAMEACTALGFTLANTPGVEDIKPRALGMKGVEVDFEKLEAAERAAAGTTPKSTQKKGRVDLGQIADESKARHFSSQHGAIEDGPGEFISLDDGTGYGDATDATTMKYNHKVRRKLRRAIEAADMKQEGVVRQRALEYCTEKGIEPPAALLTPLELIDIKGRRVLHDGTLETDKQERVRSRLELIEYNKAARVLRAQAKNVATEAGLIKFAELTGKRAPSRIEGQDQGKGKGKGKAGEMNGVGDESDDSSDDSSDSDEDEDQDGDGDGDVRMDDS
ncbi:MAG: hypothetical protein M1838_003254 [Thelocarpon superellum]|nr:MAG: hypothetical protein M1838_003254 [Thelocarpon superellum]